MDRATTLLQKIGGIQAGPQIEVKDDEHLPQAPQVALRRERIASTLGLQIADEEVEAMLLGLGLTLIDRTADGWVFKVPSYRFDLTLEVDLLRSEERRVGKAWKCSVQV